MFFRRSLPFALASFLTAGVAVAQESADEINPAEQLMADILIALAEIELDLKERGVEQIDPPEKTEDLLEEARDRVDTLAAVEIPKLVADPIQPDPPKIDSPLPQPPEIQPPKADDPITARDPGGIGVTPVSRDGKTVHSVLYQDLSSDEIAKLPETDPARCSELGEWFLTLELQRDFQAFFVAEDPHVRICRRLGASWFVKRASNGNRAHMIAVIE